MPNPDLTSKILIQGSDILHKPGRFGSLGGQLCEVMSCLWISDCSPRDYIRIVPVVTVRHCLDVKLDVKEKEASPFMEIYIIRGCIYNHSSSCDSVSCILLAGFSYKRR